MLRLAEAADGYLARVRLPGGLIGAGPIRVLARVLARLTVGRVELTSRGNVQLRGLAADAAGPLTDELFRAGLFPSPSHDRVRNVLASPLAGLDGGPDLTAIVQGLDAGLCARPRLAELPGRFLFAVDDGRGDVAGSAPTSSPGSRRATRWSTGSRSWARPRVTRHGSRGPVAADVVTVMLACAEAFLDLRAAEGGTAWRIADLTDGPARVRAAVAARLGLAAAAQPIAGLPVPAVSDGTGRVGGPAGPVVGWAGSAGPLRWPRRPPGRSASWGRAAPRSCCSLRSGGSPPRS